MVSEELLVVVSCRRPKSLEVGSSTVTNAVFASPPAGRSPRGWASFTRMVLQDGRRRNEGTVSERHRRQ
jgi:hypothetical protein